jgi:hypothetical protein
MLRKLGLIAFTLALVVQSVANASLAPKEYYEDTNPYIETAGNNGLRKFFMSKPLMEWGDGFLYASRSVKETKIYKLGYVNCLKKQSRILYDSEVDDSGGFDSSSSDNDDTYLSKEKSTTSVGKYCVNYKKNNLDLLKLPTVNGRRDSKIKYKVLERMDNTVKVFTYTPIQKNVPNHLYSILRYNCQTNASKKLFHFQTTQAGEVVQYTALTNPQWVEDEKTDDSAVDARYKKMVETFCTTK